MADPVAAVDWVRRAREVAPPAGLVVDGESRPAASGRTRTVRSPRDGRGVAEVAWADQADAEAAVRSARAAFDDGPGRSG